MKKLKTKDKNTKNTYIKRLEAEIEKYRRLIEWRDKKIRYLELIEKMNRDTANILTVMLCKQIYDKEDGVISITLDDAKEYDPSGFALFSDKDGIHFKRREPWQDEANQK